MTSVRVFGLALALGFAVCAPAASAQQAMVRPAFAFAPTGDSEFDSWRDDFAARALAAGRKEAAIRAILGGVEPDPRIVAADGNQAEFVRPVWDYVDGAVSPRRLEVGRAKRAELAPLFAAIEAKYGVDSDVVAGIWAMETNFGVAPLNYQAPQALATLAAEGRRRAQFETYLLALIEMHERGYAGAEELRSSWAGALGQPQFMPDIYLSDSVDWDGDGHRDIWTNVGDVLASISSYLARRGWIRGEPVLDEVVLPPNFDYSAADGARRPVAEWQGFGVQKVDGAVWSPEGQALSAELFLPAGAEGPALLLYNNFSVIRAYNASDRYAMGVALLARGFEGKSGLIKPWPKHQGALTREDYLELQTLLLAKGYDPGAVDGRFGVKTRAAVRAYQKAENLRPDGWAAPALLDRLRGRPKTLSLADKREAGAPLSRKQIADLQAALERLGFKIGARNGLAGPRTTRAIKAFERSLGLTPRGDATTFVLSEARARLKSK